MPRGSTPTPVRDPSRRVTDLDPADAPLSEVNVRYRLLFESNPMPMWVYDVRTLRFIDVNDAAVRKYGYTRDEFLTMTIEDIRPREDLEDLRRDVERARHGGQQVGLWRHRTKDGRTIHVEVSAHDLVLGAGRHRLVLSHDVTERVRIERYRALDYAVSRVLLEAASFQDGLPRLLESICRAVGWQFGEAWLLAPGKERLAWAGAWHPSDRALQRFREESENVTIERGVGLAGRVWETSKPAWVSDVTENTFTRRALAAEVGLHGAFALPILGRSGLLGVLATYTTEIQDPDDMLLELAGDLGTRIGLFLEREKAREAEHAISDRFRTIFSASPVPIILTRLGDGMIFDVNDAFLRLLDYSREEVMGRTSVEMGIIDPADRAGFTARLRADGRLLHQEVVIRTKAGARRPVLFSAEVVRLEGEPSLLTTVVDIAERKAAEEERARADRRFRVLFESAADAIALVDRRGQILDVNPAVEELLGRPRGEVVGKNMADLLPKEHLERARGYLRDILRGGPHEEPFEVPIDTARAGRRTLETRARVIQEPGLEPYVQILARDVTDRQELQRRLMDSERLATIGRLASFMAHEINTPLQNIALLSASVSKLTTDVAVREKIQKVEAQRRLATRIMSDLLDLASAARSNPTDTDLRAVVEEALEAVAPQRKEGVQLVSDLGAGPAAARADPLRVQQAVTNLVKNALQATERGTVTVRIEEEPGAFQIVVSDTGVGMPPDVLERIFQPFFTTKARGEGTGLGLAYAQSVAYAHGGKLSVESVSGQGSTFRLLIPKTGPLRS
jgi:PAS domain S-box-containing protein